MELRDRRRWQLVERVPTAAGCRSTSPTSRSSSTRRASRLLGDFAGDSMMSPEVLELYVFIHYNYFYEWLRPTTQEIVDAYLATYGPDAMAEDNSSDEEDDKAADDAADAPAADAPAARRSPARVRCK